MGERENAYHEAGHAVIGYLCYGERIGYIMLDSFTEAGLSKAGRVHWKRKLPESEVCPAIHLAGDIAERILRKDNSVTLETAILSIESQNAYGDWGAGNYPGLYEKTRYRLIEKWGSVEALAEALRKKKTIQGPEAEEILKQEIQK